MKRTLSGLADTEFDLIVVGGGIFGICTAWDAALRGLSVVLLEQDDFGHATSANHFKVVHGGIRYLQHGDLKRIRESSIERNALLKIAPHLVYPMPYVIPTYGHGLKGRTAMRTALSVYDLCTADRNLNIVDPARRIPPGTMLSRSQVEKMFPQVNRNGLTGAAMFYDGQIYNPARLSLAFVRSAAEAGAHVINYTKVLKFLQKGDRITGVAVHDRLGGHEIEVRGRVTVNATGPWAKWLLQSSHDFPYKREPIFSRDAYFVIKRRLVDAHALAILGQTKDPDAILSRGKRHLLLVPWRGYTLVGVWHKLFDGRPEEFTLSRDEVQAFISEVRAGNPEIDISVNDVSAWHAGLTLFGENEPGAIHLSYGKRSILVDHVAEHGIEGLISLIGVRFTTSRGMAEKTVNLVFEKLGKTAPRCRTRTTPAYGGDFDSFDKLQKETECALSTCVASVVAIQAQTDCGDSAKSLAHNHGGRYRDVLNIISEMPHLATQIEGSSVLAAEVVHAVRSEMACRLQDVILRRTDLGTGAYPGRRAIDGCARLMASELRWTEKRKEEETQFVESLYPDWVKQNTPYQ